MSVVPFKETDKYQYDVDLKHLYNQGENFLLLGKVIFEASHFNANRFLSTETQILKNGKTIARLEKNILKFANGNSEKMDVKFRSFPLNEKFWALNGDTLRIKISKGQTQLDDQGKVTVIDDIRITDIITCVL